MSVLNPFLASNSKSSDAAVYKPHGSTGVSVPPRSKVPQMAAPISDSDPSACASRATSRCYSFQLYGSHAGRRSDLTVLSVARVSEWKSDLDVSIQYLLFNSFFIPVCYIDLDFNTYDKRRRVPTTSTRPPRTWVFWARKRMRRFVRESLRLAHRGAPCHPVPTTPDRDVVRSFGRPDRKSHPRNSEAIFVEPMGCNYTHQERFRHGVDEHPRFGP